MDIKSLQLLDRMCYGAVNHLDVEVGSEDHQLAEAMVATSMIKRSGPTSKTQIKKQKLDTSKQWFGYYIGYKAGHEALAAFRTT